MHPMEFSATGEKKTKEVGESENLAITNKGESRSLKNEFDSKAQRHKDTKTQRHEDTKLEKVGRAASGCSFFLKSLAFECGH